MVNSDNFLVYDGKNWCWIHQGGSRGPRILHHLRIPGNLRIPGPSSYSILSGLCSQIEIVFPDFFWFRGDFVFPDSFGSKQGSIPSKGHHHFLSIPLAGLLPHDLPTLGVEVQEGVLWWRPHL